jgi:LPPG:FO 2-phospho-L-lactate transferase
MRLTALAGGVGAAKLLSGLVAVLPSKDLTVIVNTGDDFRWMGLYICPDLDTVTYTLAGMANPTTGWGIRDDTFHSLERLHQIGCETWFKLGDRDLATHIYRTHHLQAGDTLTDVTRALCRKNGITAQILPMTDSPVPTLVHTDEGTLEFQDYFVRKKCSPTVRGLSFQGIDATRPAPGVLEAIRDADVVVLCPSNPHVSIGPILAVPGIRTALRQTAATVLAVTPIVAGEALKGPTAAMMRQLGEEVSAVRVAKFYRDFLDVFVLDHRDAILKEKIAALGVEVRFTETIMDDMASRVALARFVLEALA